MEIEFLVNEAQISQEKSIKEILNIINTPSTEKQVMIMQKLIRALELAGKKPEEAVKKEFTSITKEFISVIKDLPPPPVPIRIQKQIQEIKKNEYELIKDKETDIVLAKVIVNDKYNLIEPKLTDNDVQIIKEIAELIQKKKINLDDKKSISNILMDKCKKYRIQFNDEYLRNIRYYLINGSQFGKITPLILDKNIGLISCYGLDQIKIIYNNEEKETNLFFASTDELNQFIKSIAIKNNIKLDELNPIADFIKDNLRFQLILGAESIQSSFLIKKL